MTDHRPYQRRELWRGVGRICIEITCPFCGEVFQGYVWSIAGSGKRCPGCGALHGSYGAFVTESTAPRRHNPRTVR